MGCSFASTSKGSLQARTGCTSMKRLIASDSAFKNAGGHVHTKTPVVHGLLNPEANDGGDLPNLFVGANGSVTVELYSALVTLVGTGSSSSLLDADVQHWSSMPILTTIDPNLSVALAPESPVLSSSRSGDALGATSDAANLFTSAGHAVDGRHRSVR
jgi:hypothetical protein